MVKRVGRNETSSEEDENITRAYEEWKEGASLRDLESKYGVSKSKLCRLFQRMEEAKATIVASSQADKMSACNGELTSKVFRLLDDGTPLSRIVIDLKVTPDIVQCIHQKWIGLKLEQARSLGYYAFTSDTLSSLIIAAKELGRALLQAEIVRALTSPSSLELCPDCQETLRDFSLLFDSDGPSVLEKIQRLQRQAGPKPYA
jgi:hypothetical protein